MYGLLFLFISVVSLHEFYNMVRSRTVLPQRIQGLITGGIIYIITFLSAFNISQHNYWIIILAISFILISELYRKHENPIENIAITVFGIIYAIVPYAILNYIVFNQTLHNAYQVWVLIGLFILIWTHDTFAYLTGISIGKHRLFERISPKKSWEGFFGGLLFSFIAAWLLSKYVPEFSIISWMIIAAIISTIGTFGDLVESMFKRSVNIKDSGSLLPGHGGLLDRFDTLLLAIPIIYAFLYLIK